MGEPSDVELVRSAQAGEVSALGLLLARHEADMRAVAMAVLGYGPDADDAVQDASLIALGRIGDVRKPEAVGSWLKMIVRNTCRKRLRNERPTASVDDSIPELGPTPEQVIENHAMRDWVWHAIGQLSEPLQIVVLLRHFTGITSYQQIAALCDVPVGTVRSRLSAARAALSTALLDTADKEHCDVATLTAESRAEAAATVAAAERGEFGKIAADRWSPKIKVTSGCRGEFAGRDVVVNFIDRELDEDRHIRVANTVVSRDFTIWEMDLISAKGEADAYPPNVAWIMTQRDGRYDHLKMCVWQTTTKK